MNSPLKPKNIGVKIVNTKHHRPQLLSKHHRHHRFRRVDRSGLELGTSHHLDLTEANSYTAQFARYVAFPGPLADDRCELRPRL
jgi:hypothetical protein